MIKKQSVDAELPLQFDADDYQKCFIGHSVDAPWRDDLIAACAQVLPKFQLQPEYATDDFEPTIPLREKVAKLIARTRYGIYDLSYWQQKGQQKWLMPRNVLIELGIAIALNRPILLLRHVENKEAGLSLPPCLEGMDTNILEFGGQHSLTKVLEKHIQEQWKRTVTTPDQDWWNCHCTFGCRVCEYRQIHPHMPRLHQKMLNCHISDGNDPNRVDFRSVMKQVLELFDDITYDYLDTLSLADGYQTLLCTYCQKIRSSSLAIYRITPSTPPETFIAIGISLALELQYAHAIPKILLTTDQQHIPSLLKGYEVLEEHNDQERLSLLRRYMPRVIQKAHQSTWKPRPLPWKEIRPTPVDLPDKMPVDQRSSQDNDDVAQTSTVPLTDVQASTTQERSPRQILPASQVTNTLKQAQKFQKQGLFNEAIDLCEYILESGFDRPDAHYFLGWLYQEQQRWENAIRQFQLLLNDPDYMLSCYYALGQCYRAQGDLRTATIHFDEAVDRVNLDALMIEESDQLIQLCQEAAEAHRLLGEQEQTFTLYNALLGFLRRRGWTDKVAQVEFMLQHVKNASPLPEGAVRELPGWLKILSNPDRILHAEALLTQIEKGKGEALEQAADIIPTSTNTLPENIRLQIVRSMQDIQDYINHGMLSTAIQGCLRVIDMAPQYLDVHQVLCEIYVSQGEIELAIAKYAILVDMYVVNGRIDDAIASYRRILQLEPNNLTYRMHLINLLSVQGNKEDLRLERTLAAESYVRQGDMNRALTELEQALQESPTSVPARLNYALALQKLGRTQQAVMEYQHVLQIDPHNITALVRLHIAMITIIGSARSTSLEILTHIRWQLRDEGQKHMDEAIRAYNQCVDTYPNNADAHFALGQIYHQAGLFDKAINAYVLAMKDSAVEMIARVSTAQSLLMQGKHEAAILQLKQTLQHVRRSPSSIDPVTWAARPREDGQLHLAPEEEITLLLVRINRRIE